VAFPAFNGQATSDGGLGNRRIRRATFVTGAHPIARALVPNHSRFAFVA
jgi:hypothetical protein